MPEENPTMPIPPATSEATGYVHVDLAIPTGVVAMGATAPDRQPPERTSQLQIPKPQTTPPQLPQAQAAQQPVSEEQKQVDKKQVEKTETANGFDNIMQKISSDNEQSPSVEPKAYQTFVMTGIVMLIVALVGMLFNKPLLVLFIILIGIAQLVFGFMLKRRET